MKKIIQSIGLMTLICFSFIYTDKVMEVISEKDSIMIEIEEKKDNYKVDVKEAILNDNTIIPGITGKEVNVTNSYQNMKELGVFREDLLLFYTTYPKILLENNYDKYIISGNNSLREVSVIIKIIDKTNVDSLLEIINNYQVEINLFIDSAFLNSNINDFIDNKYINIYSYGNNGKYTHDNILTSNNIVKSKTGNKPIYCLSENMNSDTINVCEKEKMFTIYPTIIGKDTPYNNIKTNLKNGSIISLELSSSLIKELPSIIEFIKGKGLDIVYLDTLLSENKN